jgi:pentatricopeptide repeat protein
LLHILAALSLYKLVDILFGKKILSLFTCLLFLVHPIHTEVVSYISGRADSLALFFMLLCLIGYIRYLDSGGKIYFILFCSSYALALLSRENSLVLPAIILLYHYVFQKKIKIGAFFSLVSITFLYMLLRLTILSHLISFEKMGISGSFIQKAAFFFSAFTGYLRLLILPFNLHMEYAAEKYTFASPSVILGLTFLISLVGCAFLAKRKDKLIFFSIFLFIIGLIPVSNIYPLSVYMAEHWLYMPSIGFFLLSGAVFARFYEDSKFRVISVAAIFCLLALYSFLTYSQNRYWRDNVYFYERTLKFSPGSLRVQNDLAIAYQKKGQYEKAIKIYEKMLEKNPEATDIYVNLAASYVESGEYGKAISVCADAIRLEPVNATAHNNLAVAYYASGNFDLAAKHCMLAMKYGYRVDPRLLKLLKIKTDDHAGE